jgi:hypothetical protein
MIVSCASPFRAVAIGWQPRRGYCGLTVICKATYQLTPNTSSPSQPTEIVLADLMGPDGATVQLPSDIAPFKAQAEVLLLDHPRGLGGRVAVAGIDCPADQWGSIARCEASRCCLILDRWRPDGVLQLPPLDAAEPTSFNVAPAHQRLSAFPQEIEISLVGLRPSLTTRLASVAPRVFLSLNDGERMEIPVHCDTLAVVADRGAATLIWRAFSWIPPAAVPQVVVVADRELAMVAAPEATIETTAEVPALNLPDDPLPFAGRRSAPTAARAAAQPNIVPVPHALPSDSLEATAAISALVDYQPAIPFGSPSIGAAPPNPKEAPWSKPPMWVIAATTPAQAAPSATALASARTEQSASSAAADPAMLAAHYSLEECAAIAAAVAYRPKERDAILQRHELDDARWQILFSYCDVAMGNDAKRGKTSRMRHFDEAYCAEIERLRGPIAAEDWARIVVGVERGEEAAALAALDLPADGLPHLQRHWLARIATDQRLGKRVRDAIHRLRDE